MKKEVYENDFGRRGTSFIVNGRLNDLERAYLGYLDDVGVESAISFNTFCESERTDHEDQIITTIRSSCADFFSKVQSALDPEESSLGDGQSLLDQGSPKSGLATFDIFFSLLHEFNGEIEVGLRHWEQDYVVGVSLKEYVHQALPEDISALEISVEEYTARKRDLVLSLASYLKCDLVADLYEVLEKVGPHETAPYARADLNRQREVAVSNFARCFSELNPPKYNSPAVKA